MVQALGRQEPRAAQSSTRLAQCRHRYCNVAQPLHGVAEPMANPALTHGFDAWRRDSDACRRVTDVQPPCLTCWHRKPTARPERVFFRLNGKLRKKSPPISQKTEEITNKSALLRNILSFLWLIVDNSSNAVRATSTGRKPTRPAIAWAHLKKEAHATASNP